MGPDLNFALHCSKFLLIWIIGFKNLWFQSPEDDLVVVTPRTDKSSIVFEPHYWLNWACMSLVDLVDALILPEPENMNTTILVVKSV